MTIPPMDNLSRNAIELRFDPDTVRRGTQYFDEGRVGYVAWHSTSTTLTAAVRGNRSTPYSATVSVTLDQNRIVDIDYGHCNCPMVFNCKHVVAVILQARRDSRSAALTSAVTGPRTHWSSALELIRSGPPETDNSTDLRIGLQLGIEPSLDRADAVRLLARPLRWNGLAWSTANISWSSLPLSTNRRVERQVDILRELGALHQIRSCGRSAHTFYRSDSSSIDLADVACRMLWDLLTEAQECGLTMVNAHRPSGEISAPAIGEFAVDITSDPSGGLELAGRVTVDGLVVPSTRRRFLGPDASGIVYWDDDDDSNLGTRLFRLVRLNRSVPAGLRKIAASPRTTIIPAPDRTQFVLDYLPALERQSTLVSSDRSYTPPTIAGPELHIAVTHLGDGVLEVGSHWRYHIYDDELDFDAATLASSKGIRDRTSEVALLRTVLDLLERPDSRPGTFPSFTIGGTAAALFVVDRVSLLHDYDNVHVSTAADLPDFRDVGEDIGISLSTTALHGDNDWFDLGVTVTVDGTEIELATVLTAIAHGSTHLLLPTGGFFSLDRPSLLTLRTLVQEARSLQDAPEGPLRISRYQASLWEELAEIGEIARQADTWRQQVAGLLSLDSVAPQLTPSTLDAELRPYQRDGYSWLLFLWSHGLGGILADDMGLGKTVQTLAMIAKISESGPLAAPFVIVAPTSVVHNWAREAARFVPGLTVVTAAGTRARRRNSIADVAAGADILVTSYTVFRLDFDDFAAVSWSGLILDEAQYVKNHKSKTYHCARQLAAPFKLAITGTPMENNVMELWALLSITAPGLFPSPSTFIESYRTPIEREGDTRKLATLRRRIKPLVLRRTKDTVAQDLPPKQEQTVMIDLHPRHRKVYETRLARERQKILGLLHDFQRNRVTILQSLTILRQLSLDASLVDAQYSDIPSAKVDELMTQLAEVLSRGHRVLVFSQFTRFLGRVRDKLEAAGISLVYLDGSTRDRAEVVEKFRSGQAHVFLISLKAGGVGLTLTEADYCFVLDPWWNPAAEAQAVDRAHRIGQTRTVFVNRYVAKDTIEEKVMELKARKAALFASVMDDDSGAFAGSVTADDIRGLLE